MWLYDTIFFHSFVSSCFLLHFVCGYDLWWLEHATNFRSVLFWKWVQVFLIIEIFCKKSKSLFRSHFDSFPSCFFMITIFVSFLCWQLNDFWCMVEVLCRDCFISLQQLMYKSVVKISSRKIYLNLFAECDLFLEHLKLENPKDPTKQMFDVEVHSCFFCKMIWLRPFFENCRSKLFCSLKLPARWLYVILRVYAFTGHLLFLWKN